VDLFIDRQIQNGEWLRQRGARRYEHFARELATRLARTVARFESDYIFCWIDWDGDNLLADGGIIDYGSVRQFGLYHREYRFDDGPRWSTTLPEQRLKARQLVRCFAQIRDFLATGRKRPISAYRSDRAVKLFDAEFERHRLERLVHRIGFPDDVTDSLVGGDRRALLRFARAHAYFERARAARGPCRVPDGLSWNAIFCTRDLLRELPTHYRERFEPIDARSFMGIAASTYASRRDRSLTPHRRRMALEFQRAYLELIARAARRLDRPVSDVLRIVERRSADINRRDRITGDGVDYATSQLLRARKRLTSSELHAVVRGFVEEQGPRTGRRDRRGPPRGAARRVLERLLHEIHDFRHGL
jgi:hypothetical protein